MSKVKIQGNASGTGVLTVTAPNTSTDRTITLPDATGTLLNSDGDGSNLTGISSVGGATGVDFNDNVKARFGTGNDLEMFHDGSHSYIKDLGTGNLKLMSDGAAVSIEETDGTNMILCRTGGSMDLYHNGTKKFETSATGVTVTGAIGGATNLGKVLQVVKGGISNVSTHSAGASTYDTVYNVSISGVQSTSTIIGFVMFQGYISSAGADFSAFVFRGSTSIGGGTAADSAASALIVNRRETDANVSFHASGQFEDTGHGGGSLTYDFKVMNENTLYLGRPSQSGQPRHGRGQNNMILMEIGA